MSNYSTPLDQHLPVYPHTPASGDHRSAPYFYAFSCFRFYF